VLGHRGTQTSAPQRLAIDINSPSVFKHAADNSVGSFAMLQIARDCGDCFLDPASVCPVK
jgi:hypothetical protein